jgi:hypothetical protein
VQAWKPLLLIVPAGLLLGALGGQYARPVMTQRPDDGLLQSLLGTRGERSGAAAAEAAPDDASYYSGEYSYPPYLDDRMGGQDREITGWQGPSFAGWPEYKPAPMPSVAQLEAEVAARDAALGQRASGEYREGRDDESAAEAAADAAGDAAANAADQARSTSIDSQSSAEDAKDSPPASPAAPSAEPRTADGNLPAIW